MNKINKMLLLIWFSLDAGLHAGLLLVSCCIAGQSSTTSCTLLTNKVVHIPFSALRGIMIMVC
ncbi:hypothetical protein V6Z12_D06G127000 [Gossypium hirsutum]